MLTTLLTQLQKENTIIGISLLVVGAIICAVFVGLHFYFRNLAKQRNFARTNSTNGIWDFTKRNLPVVFALFGFIIAFSGIMLLIG